MKATPETDAATVRHSFDLITLWRSPQQTLAETQQLDAPTFAERARLAINSLEVC
jgi:hypothetical protein